MWIEELQSDAFFVTLNKSETEYSPSTLYRDYALSPTLFHWESQSTTSVDSKTGQRYINHRQRGTNILIFVREAKEDDLGTSPYVFLGPAEYVSHEGDRNRVHLAAQVRDADGSLPRCERGCGVTSASDSLWPASTSSGGRPLGTLSFMTAEPLTPNELARALDVQPVTIRTYLRSKYGVLAARKRDSLVARCRAGRRCPSRVRSSGGPVAVRTDDLIRLYPEVFHMAADGSWPSIERHGLLSSAALVDRWELEPTSALEAADRATRGLPRARARHPRHCSGSRSETHSRALLG